MSQSAEWQVVLYGRTFRADSWWRVRPPGIDLAWLNGLVIATTGGGEDLSDGPRYMLARNGECVLVGAAARAALLHQTWNSDGSRPLYCFVGWLSRDRDAAVPSLDAVEDQWVTWARPAYKSWMRLDWEKHPSDLTKAHESPFDRPPWAGTAAELTAIPSAGGTRRAPGRGGAMNVPAQGWAGAWAELLMAPGDFAIAGVFRGPMADPAGVLTHVIGADRDVSQSEEPSYPPAGPGPSVPPHDRHDGPLPQQRHPEQPLHGDKQLQELGRPTMQKGSPVDPSAPSGKPPPAEPHRLGGVFRKKVGKAIKSLSTEPEVPGYDDADEGASSAGEDEPGAPQRGPTANLDYWVTHTSDPPPEQSRQKRPPEQ